MDNSDDIITSVARIEQNIYNNGSEIGGKWCNMIRYGDGIASGRNGEEVEVSEDSYFSPYQYKLIINLYDKPVFWSHVKNLDPELRRTKGFYCIKYIPKTDKRRKKGRPWFIGQDLIRHRCYVSGPKHWKALCERVPEYAWIQRNSILTDRYFDIAAQHPGVTFWFCIDLIRYEDMLQKKVKEMNIKKYGQAFVSHVPSVLEYKKDIKDKHVILREWIDILKEINGAEKDPSVQEEMKENAGEVYDRSRKCPRDPATGRFIFKNNKEE